MTDSEMNYCVDNTGKYLGAFDYIPNGATAAISAPEDARQIYNKVSKTWSAKPVDAPAETSQDRLLATLKVALPLAFTDAKIAVIKG